MSSNIPVSLSHRISAFRDSEPDHHHPSISQTRRVTRTARAAAVKENENANARPSRISTRTKPLGSTSTTAGLTGATGGVTRATAASRAKTSVATDSKVDIHAGKRKREALGEVAAVGNNKPSGVAAKGKEKETFDGVIIKGKGVATRQPLRTVASTRQESQVVVHKETTTQVKREHDVIAHADDNAMVVDQHPNQVALPKLAVRRSTVIKESQITKSRAEGHRRTSLRSSRHVQEEYLEEEPVHKKRRTSSIPPEEDPEVIEEAQAQTEEELRHARLTAEMEAFAEEPEADPEDSAWEDLDADDIDDPLMVSEYVQDIFKYLKEVEVCLLLFFSFLQAILMFYE